MPVDAGWLSEVLGRPVTAVDATTRDGFNSETSHLRLTYGDGERADVILKRNVPCLASGVDETTGDSYLLLADLSGRPGARRT